MYQGFYNLKENPFRLTPDPNYVCMTEQHREALSGLIYSVWARPGLTVLAGEAGTGKTTLLYTLINLLEKRQFTTALCTNPMLSREEFFDLLMIKFHIDCPSGLKSRRLQALEEALLRNRTAGTPSVLIIDEAQRLPLDLLEEVRLLLNMEVAEAKLLQIIMAGQPELMDVLQRPELRQLKQRVSCYCRLHPLSLGALSEYLEHRLAQAGQPHQTLFSDAVIARIYEHTTGIPRLVNSLCDNTLQTGFSMQAKQITTAIVDEAARDLELIRLGTVIPGNGTSAAIKADALPPLAVGVHPPAPLDPVLPKPPMPAVVIEKPNHFPATPAAMADQMMPLAEPRTARTPVLIPEEPCAEKTVMAAPKTHVPLENYASRQKSLNFFSSLIERWR